MKSAAPFLSPPGLEAQPMSLQSLEERLRQLGPEVPHESLIQAMREVVLAEVEQKVQGKVEELWAKGKQAFSQAQQKQREQMQRVLEEVAQCQARQASLTAENERLSEALRTLSSKCSSLPGYVPDSLASPGSTLAGTPPLQEEPNYSAPFTPIPFAPVSDFPSYAGEAGLPEVPVMPLASPGVGAPGCPAPLSLAEALGPPGAPLRTPLSLAESLVPESDVGSPQSQNRSFSVTIAKAPDSELGLDVSHEPGGKVLRVDGIRPTGAVKAWNQQCLASSTPEQAIAVGDKITSVNNVAADPVKMLKACVSQQTLSLEIEREGPNTSPVRSGVLRAEATEFIPRTGLEVPNIADE